MHLQKEVAKTTIAGILTKTKAILNWAVASGWLEKSPLDGVGRGSFADKSKDRIVTLAEYKRLLGACPEQNWRTLISLARIGGVRSPSEALRLKWSDVHWDTGQFFIRSPKTERYAGKEGRMVPIFCELKEELEALYFSDESERREYVVNLPGYSNREKANIVPGFARIAERAGLVIGRPFDNLRMTRSNEVYRRFGSFAESEWIGHSSRVRKDHYLMLTDEDFLIAAKWKTPAMESSGPVEKIGDEHGKSSPETIQVG